MSSVFTLLDDVDLVDPVDDPGEERPVKRRWFLRVRFDGVAGSILRFAGTGHFHFDKSAERERVNPLLRQREPRVRPPS